MKTVLNLLLILALFATISHAADFTDPTTGMEFVFVKGGCYKMGDAFTDIISAQKPVHEVCVDDFYIGKYEVTQAEFQKAMGMNSSQFKKCGPNCPVENVSWNDAQAFASKLAGRNGVKFRLPYEAEWEYAARSGGKQEQWAGGSELKELGDYAWFEDNSGMRTHPVGLKRRNGLGIYDMSGNVWEWCKDWYDEKYYGKSPQKNPPGELSGFNRSIRGGSWHDSADYAQAAYRTGINPIFRYGFIGFRLVLPAVR